MDDLNTSNEYSNQPIQAPKKKSIFVNGVMNAIVGGLIGSALTLAGALQFGILEPVDAKSDTGVQSLETINTSNVIATQTSASNQSNSIADMLEYASTAIVGISNKQQTGHFMNESRKVESGSGTGVVFKRTADAAYIVTNNHVIEGATEIEISLHNGEKTTAQLVGTDALTDLAVLQIDPKYANNVLEFGDSSLLRAGDQVLAIGNPLGIEFSRTVTQGIVSAVDRTIPVSTSAGNWNLNVIQTDAAINPGNSGGALINVKGEVVGINSLKISVSGIEGLGFAIPSNDVLPIVNEMIETGKVERPYIGVSLTDLEEIPNRYLQDLPTDVTTGVMVTYVDPNSAAYHAGMKVQDVIVGINDEEIKSASDLRKHLYTNLQVGEEIILKVYRGSELMTIKIILTSNNVLS